MPLDDAHSSVSEWIDQLRRGELDAARKLWNRYYDQMVRIARAQLRDQVRGRLLDEEDIASRAFECFYRAIKANRYPDLTDRDNLWRVLFRIVKNKAIDEQRRERRLRAGNGKVRGDSAFTKPENSSSLAEGINSRPTREPTPDEAAAAVEQVRFLLSLLTDPPLRHLAERKFEGYTNKEIASAQGNSLATVERQLRLIRRIFKEAVSP